MLLTLCAAALAGPIDTFGAGAAAMGRGGGGVALPDGVAGVFLNPAALTELERSSVLMGFSLLRSELEALPEVRWDTNLDGRIDDTDAPLQPSADYGRADGLFVGLGRPIGDRIGVALSAFLPANSVLNISTFDPAMPTWFMYENQLNRFEASAGAGWEQFPGVRVGGAIEVLARVRYEMVGALSATVTGAETGEEEVGELIESVTLDLHEMNMLIEPAFAPVLAIHWDVGELLPALEGLRLGATWRGSNGLPVDVAIDLQLDASIADVGELDTTTLAFLAPLNLALFDHYVPARLTLGGAWELEDALRVYGDLRRTAWKDMILNVAQVTDSALQGQLLGEEIPIADANAYSLTLASTWSVRTGVELRLPAVALRGQIGDANLDGAGTLRPVLRGGWSIEPTPLQQLGTDVAFLDTDRMMFTAGLGVEHGAPFGLIAGPIAWDAFYQHHPLASGDIPVSYSDPYTAGAPIGVDAIPVGGRLWAAGLQWRMDY